MSAVAGSLKHAKYDETLGEEGGKCWRVRRASSGWRSQC